MLSAPWTARARWREDGSTPLALPGLGAIRGLARAQRSQQVQSEVSSGKGNIYANPHEAHLIAGTSTKTKRVRRPAPLQQLREPYRLPPGFPGDY